MIIRSGTGSRKHKKSPLNLKKKKKTKICKPTRYNHKHNLSTIQNSRIPNNLSPIQKTRTCYIKETKIEFNPLQPSKTGTYLPRTRVEMTKTSPSFHLLSNKKSTQQVKHKRIRKTYLSRIL